VPAIYAAASAGGAVGRLSTPTSEGIRFFCESRSDCFVLRGYTGYLYGACNLTFQKPIEDASKVKKIRLKMKATIFHGFAYDDIVYFNETASGVSIPYYRLHAVNGDGSVNPEKFFSFTSINVPEQNKVLTVELSHSDVLKLANDGGGIETLQWSVYTTRSTNDGVSYLYFYQIEYELFQPSDYHKATFMDGNIELKDEVTAHTVSPLESVAKKGYSAVWKKADGALFDFDKPLAGDVILYLSWAKNSYTVTFNTMGGTSVAPVAAEYGAKIEPPNPPEREGYTFAGWYQDPQGAQKYNFSEMDNQNITLYALWNQKKAETNPPDEGCGAAASGSVSGLPLWLCSAALGAAALRKYKSYEK
jgi:uncharacterized repeat protein (TIGR02543 family)